MRSERSARGYGYRLVRISGSHHIFEKPDRQLLSIPVHRGKVKPFYVRQIQRIIDEEESPGESR
jgi:predicted RNA binding protein YcfA (HicA-like mRNA interferase family)